MFKNEKVEEKPGLINTDPEATGWLFRWGLSPFLYRQIFKIFEGSYNLVARTSKFFRGKNFVFGVKNVKIFKNLWPKTIKYLIFFAYGYEVYGEELKILL